MPRLFHVRTCTSNVNSILVPRITNSTHVAEAVTSENTTTDSTGIVDAVLEKVASCAQECQKMLDDMDCLLFLPVEEVDLEMAKASCRNIALTYQTLNALVEEVKALCKSKKPRAKGKAKAIADA